MPRAFGLFLFVARRRRLSAGFGRARTRQRRGNGLRGGLAALGGFGLLGGFLGQSAYGQSENANHSQQIPLQNG